MRLDSELKIPLYVAGGPDPPHREADPSLPTPSRATARHQDPHAIPVYFHRRDCSLPKDAWQAASAPKFGAEPKFRAELK